MVLGVLILTLHHRVALSLSSTRLVRHLVLPVETYNSEVHVMLVQLSEELVGAVNGWIPLKFRLEIVKQLCLFLCHCICVR